MNMSATNSLSHLSDEDKKEILDEIKFYMSEKGFIDGVAFYGRMESVLGCQGDLPHEHRRQMKERRIR